MPASRIGSIRNAGSSGTSLTPAYNQPPTAGNLLIFSVMQYRSSTTAPTASVPDGWTQVIGGNPARNGNIWCGLWVFIKVATGNDALPITTLTGNSYRYSMEEWAGLSLTPFDKATPLASFASGAAITIANSPAISVTEGQWLYTATALRCSTGPDHVTFDWSGGTSTNLVPNDSTNTLGSGTQTATASGSVTPGNNITINAATLTAAQTATAAFFMLGGGTTTPPAMVGQVKIGLSPKPAKVYIGGQWVRKPVKVWNGTDWATTKY